ncbi:MAG TPA: hypothetical protein VNS46_19885 [Nocardioides sp.]|nr:hypothetical protein [Nocardioides sp.]
MTGRLRDAFLALGSPRALVALAVALAITTAGTLLAAGRDDRPSQPTDIAFLDADATADLVSSTTNLVNQVFSVDPRRPKATARLIETHLTDAARQQFRDLYAPYLSKQSAGITLQTSATSVAVVTLREDSADVLVVADQQASAPDGRTNAGTAAIRLSLTGGSGNWRIAAIDPV